MASTEAIGGQRSTVHPPGVPTQDVALRLEHVSRHYGSGDTLVVALDDLSLTLHRGSWTAVMGPSGSGKSTLLHCAGGLERPDAGQVWLGDRNLATATDRELTALRRRDVGFIFQNLNLVASLTAAQNVALPLRVAGQPPARQAVRQVLADVGLADRGRHRPRELSGGQQQRVAIARAIITRPAVLLADEPTGALDSITAREVLALLRSRVAESGQTIVMVTHDPVAAAAADHVVFLSDGRLVDDLQRPTASVVAARLAQLGG